MDDRKDFGTLDHSRLASATAGGLYGPSAVAAAAAAAVNSGLMQLPSLADTAGRLGVMEGCPVGLTPAFGCPPGLHVDYPGGAISGIGSLAQLRGWYGPGPQNQGSPYSDLFGAYAGPGSNWRSLSTPPAPDHFHSPLPGMTHPMWPCPPTPVPCSDGCSLSYCNPPSLYSAYSAYISSLMSSSGASEYPPYLSPRLPGPPPIPSYQQRLHDMHKAYLLSNSAGGNATSEFPSHWNPYLTGSSAAVPLLSPGYIGSVGQVGFGFSGDSSSTSSRCISVEEQKQSIKQEPLSNKTKTKDVMSADHRSRDGTRRDQQQLWERSSISRQEPLTESKAGLVTKKLLKDEKLPSPIASDCSLDMCNNNINHDKKQHLVNGSKSVGQNFNLQATGGSVRSTETPETLNSVEFKPHLKSLQSPRQNDDADDGRNSRLSHVSRSGKEGLNESLKGVSRVQMTPEPNCCPSLCSDLREAKQSTNAFSFSAGTGQNGSDAGSSISQADDQLVQDSSAGCLLVSDLTSNSKIDIELPRASSADDMPAAVSSDNTSANITAASSSSHPMTGDSLHDSDSRNDIFSSTPSDKPTNGTSCIIQHSVYFEEISNDGIDADAKTDAEGECDEVDEKLATGVRCDVTPAASLVPPPFSKLCDNSIDSSQQPSHNTKTELSHLVSPLPVPFPLPSSASAALSFVSMSPSLSSISNATMSMSSPSMSSSSSDVSAFSSAALKVPSILKDEAQNVPLQATALTLYVDSSVKPPKTSVSDGVNCASGQEIDLAMPRQSMRYQVSHQRHHPMQDGCKVHAPTFLPEVCTLLSNAITTTITVSSSGGSPSSLRGSASSTGGRNNGNPGLTSKTPASQRPGRSSTKSRNCAGGQNVTDISIKTEKQMKFSTDSSSPIESREIVSSGKGQTPSLLSSTASCTSGRTHTLLDRVALADHPSSQPAVHMDISISKAWSQSVVGGSLFGSILPSNYLTCLSSSSGGQYATTDQRHSIRCSASQFTIAHMSMPPAVASASSKCTSVGHHVEGRDLPLATVPIMSHSVVGASFAIRNVEDPLSLGSVTSTRSTDSSGVSQWDDDNGVPENLSTKPTVSEAEMATSEIVKQRQLGKPALLSSLNRDGLPVSRHPANSQVDGSSGNNIPVGIARALQRTIPQPAPACSSEDVAHISPDVSLALDRPLTTDGKPDNTSSNGILSSDEHAGEKTGALCTNSSQVDSENGPGSGASSDKQPCWRNDSETMRSPLFPTSFNRAWLPPGGKPPTHPASINPATLWMGQFPFAPGALLPYSAGSIDRSPSQHLFHPTGGYKLAQDSITGQFFFIPVPDMPWPNLGPRHIFQDPTMQLSNKEKETICATRAAEDGSPSRLFNRARSEEVRADVTSSVATQAGHPSNDISTSQHSDLSSSSSNNNNCLPSKMDHHSLPEAPVEINPLGQYPIVYPAARPPYFFCDSNLFVHESDKQKEKTRISVESRGTSPILQHPELDLLECSENKSSLKEKERVSGVKGEADHEKTTLNASVQTTNQSSPLPQSPEKAFTAEISIQTSDISDSDSDDSLSTAKQKPKFSKLKRQSSLCNKIIKLKDSNKHVANDVGLKSKAKEYTGLINRTVKDPALSDITSDEDECDPSVILTRQSMLSRCLLNREDASEAQKSEIAVCRMDQSMQEFQCSSLLSHPDSEQLNKRDVTGTGFSDLIQAATTEFGSSRSTDNCQDAETLLTSLIAESDNQGLDGLLMLSVVASKHTPAAVSEIPHKATNITDSLSFPVSSSTENNAGCPSVRRFNIFDLPISSLIEAERSPDVSASYNVPKPCFFDEKEFNIDLNDCVRHQNGSEPATEDFKSGILKSDEGPENMDPMELDLRMKMAEVQMKYKQEQKELARLQRKSCDLRNNSSQKRKKTKPVSKQTLQRKSSTGKRVSGSSDSSTDSSSDDEEPNPKFSKKNSKSKTDVKFTACSNAVSNLTEDVNGIKIKVSNPQRRASSASVSSSSSQFQKKSISSQKEHRLSKDSSDSGKDSRTLKPFARISMSEMDGELNPVFEKAMPGHSDNAEEERAKMLEMNKRKPDLPRKFNSVTEDMLLPKKPKQFCFYSYKKSKSSSSATLNSLDKDIKKHKYRIADSKKSTKQKHLTKAEAESHKTVDDWYRRRSERIFLHEASVGSVSSPPGTTSSQISGLDDRSLPSSPTKTNSKSRSQSQDVAPKSLASSLKSELSVTVKPCTPMTSDNLSTKRLLVSSDSSGNDSNSDSDSDTDNAPLSTLVQKESPTGLKPCTIGKDDLADGLRVLYLKDELFYEGTVKAIQPPDVYRISIDGERSSRQEIVSQEQLLERAILNVRPTSKDQLAEGCRICAYWSQKFSCLYPGTVKTDGFESDDDDSVVNVEFDDGDTGKIPLAHISMLPPGYQIQESRHPAITLVSRKRRNTTDEPEADQLQQQRPSLVNRSMSVGGDSSAQYHLSDRLSRALADVCSRHSSSIRPKSGGKSETRRSMSQELKGKKDTQEYSCRLKTEGGATGKPATASEVGLISKKSSQKGDVVENCERDSSKEHNPSATDQKKSHLTLTIKRKQSIDKETGSSIDEDEYNGSSSDDEMPRSHRYHERRKKSMRLERIDSRSASDSDEMTAAEAAKRKGDQKRKRRSSNKTSKSKKRHRSSSSESGDQIGAFRPVWEQWQWHGPCTKRPGMKGRAKKRFYRAIQRGNEILKVGEAAVFVSMGHNDLQYVGCIDCLWESWDGNMVVKVKWYYHPEETKGGKRLHEIKSALYQSSHEDENDVQTVSHKCEVLSYTSFKKFQAKKYHVDCRPEDVFYLAGTYDPTISMITYEPDVPLNSH